MWTLDIGHHDSDIKWDSVTTTGGPGLATRKGDSGNLLGVVGVVVLSTSGRWVSGHKHRQIDDWHKSFIHKKTYSLWYQSLGEFRSQNDTQDLSLLDYLLRHFRLKNLAHSPYHEVMDLMEQYLGKGNCIFQTIFITPLSYLIICFL